MTPLDLVNLVPLMPHTRGSSELTIGLIDGPVALSHPDLAGQNIREVAGARRGVCSAAGSFACMHGTFVAGILSARRGAQAPAICPDCILLVRPIFAETTTAASQMPGATPEELAAALVETVDAGARVINLSAALVEPSAQGDRALQAALDYSAAHSVIVIAAAGNQANVGSTQITRHPGVIPVAACDLLGRPLDYSNLGPSIGRRGLTAPGDKITSLGADGNAPTLSGTSAAAPFVTGTIALLWSEFPKASAAQVKLAVSRASAPRRTIVPPLLDAWSAYQALTAHFGRN